MKWTLVSLVSILTIATVGVAGNSESEPNTLFLADVASSWGDIWNEKKLSSKATRYISVVDDGKPVLMGHSSDAASALCVPMAIPLGEKVNLSWRWKVTRGLAGNSSERVKSGDDYAARVLVSFSPDLLKKDSQTLCYVWAGREAVSSIYPSPYSSHVTTIVLESGSQRFGEWVTETRDIVADYPQAFGRLPDAVYGIAVMVDTDNTNSRATAWFSDILLNPAPGTLIPSNLPVP